MQCMEGKGKGLWTNGKKRIMKKSDDRRETRKVGRGEMMLRGYDIVRTGLGEEILVFNFEEQRVAGIFSSLNFALELRP